MSRDSAPPADAEPGAGAPDAPMNAAAELPGPMAVLPHRPPFLYLDRVLVCEGMHCVAERTFHADEPFFAGHFPGYPVVPGVILIEALAQALGYLALRHKPGHLVLLTGVEGCRLRNPVRPGETVRLDVTIEKHKLNLVVARAEATRPGPDGRPVRVLEATLKGMVAPPPG